MALPVLSFAIPSRPVPHSLIQRNESTSSSGPFPFKRVTDGLQVAAVGTETTPDDPNDGNGGLGIVIKRDSGTDEGPDEPGRVI